MERRGKSSPASGEPDGPANPIRSNTVERRMRRPGASLGGGIERRRQRRAKIDGCSRQNPAYRPGRIFKPFRRFRDVLNGELAGGM